MGAFPPGDRRADVGFRGRDVFHGLARVGQSLGHPDFRFAGVAVGDNCRANDSSLSRPPRGDFARSRRRRL